MVPTFRVYGEGSKMIFPGLPCSDELFSAKTWWGPGDLDKEKWLKLGLCLLAIGYNVNVLGTPTTDGEGVSDCIGLGVSKRGKGKQPRTVIMRDAVLGGVDPEAAHAEGVSSASALAMKLARLEIGDEAMDYGASWTSALCSWSGPMMVYRGGAPRVSAWDQTKAYRGALNQPFKAVGATWQHGGPMQRRGAMDWLYRVRTGEITGFALARVEQAGHYPAWPAACAGDAARIPLVGTSLIAIPLWSLAILWENSALEVLGFERTLCAKADANIGPRIRERLLPWPKAVYQRLHAAMTPCPRWSGKLRTDGRVEWSFNQPDPTSGRSDMASQLRSCVAAKTATFLARLNPGAAVASHVDGVYETQSEGCPPVSLEAPIQSFHTEQYVDAEDGAWCLRADRQWGRFYAPGRWDFAGAAPRMGAQPPEGTGADGPLFMRARNWSGDPREDHRATSEPVKASGEFYSYTWTRSDIIEGEHGF